MESSIAAFLIRQLASELLPTSTQHWLRTHMAVAGLLGWEGNVECADRASSWLRRPHRARHA